MDDALWQRVAPHVLSQIFEYSTKKDRVAFSSVCRKWRDALHVRKFWKDMAFYLDRDFADNEVLESTDEFQVYMTSLTVGWLRPHGYTVWGHVGIREMTRRVSKWIDNLLAVPVKLESFKIFDWCGPYALREIICQLSRLIRAQRTLKKVTFCNINLLCDECIPIFKACSTSSCNIVHLEIHCHYKYYHRHLDDYFDIAIFLDALEQFTALRHLKLDYYIAAKPGVIYTISMNCFDLETIELFFQEIDLGSSVVPEKHWENLKDRYPDLKINFCVKNVAHYEQISFLFLRQNVHLSSFAIVTNTNFDEYFSRNFVRVLYALIEKHQPTLEVIELNLKNNKEDLDEVLLELISRCPNFKFLSFNGMVCSNVQLFRRIHRMKNMRLKVEQQPKPIMNVCHVFA